ncbi:hypothetical protein [Solibacillus sp. FSL K6-1523]|uniref:hypothetical protein n=1 Tax=Solibacillus sp. FSL K6-1523 TaxID=2921471 RepID=UPI0030F52713
MSEVLNVAMTTFLPYFAPIIFILLTIAVADRLREVIVDAFFLNGGGKRRTS